jgi:hypothetical protein
MKNRSRILRKNSGIPKIGDKKSAHQARFQSSPINCLPNLVFSNYCQIWIIRTHPNSSEFPNSVIPVTEYLVIWSFGYSGHPNNQIFGYLVIRLFGLPNIWLFSYLGQPKKPNLAINKSGCQIWHVFDAAMTTASFDQLM